jgi:hypothetical protein
MVRPTFDPFDLSGTGLSTEDDASRGSVVGVGKTMAGSRDVDHEWTAPVRPTYTSPD